jgi:hypothetical protein
MIERLVQQLTFLCQHARRDLYSRAAQEVKPFAAVTRIGVGRTRHDPENACADNGLRARRSASMSATWLEGDIKRGAFGMITASLCSAKRFDFRVRFSGAPMPAAAYNPAVLDQHGTYRGIG